MSLMDIQPQLPIFREIASFYHLKIVKNADFDSLITIWTYKFQIKLCLDGKYSTLQAFMEYGYQMCEE